MNLSIIIFRYLRFRKKTCSRFICDYINFIPQRNYLQQQFKDLYELVKKTDISFLGAVKAQEKKQLNGLDKLEKRLLKAEKRKFKDEIGRLITIQEYLFPEQKLQERTINFSEFYLDYGENLITI